MPDFVSPHQANRSFANAVFLGQRIVRFGLNLLANASYHFPRQASAAVMGLLARRCPPAIVWAISLVVVFSIQSQCFAVTAGGGPLLESQKIRPFFADSYPAPTVTAVSPFFGVGAPLVHPLPNLVEPTTRLAVHDFGFFVAARQTEISGIGAIRPTLNNNAARGARKRVSLMLCHSHSVDESFGCVNAYGTGFLTDDADEE